MDNLALSNALATPVAVVAANNSQASSSSADASSDAPFGDVLSRQLALADAQQANPKGVKALLSDAVNEQIQLSESIQPIDIIRQIEVDPALLVQRSTSVEMAGQLSQAEPLVDALKKAEKSDRENVVGDPLLGQQDAVPVIAAFPVGGNVQPTLGVSSGKDLPVAGVGGSADKMITSAVATASAEQISAESADAASFSARLESALTADGGKVQPADMVVGNQQMLSAKAEKAVTAAPTSAGIPQQVGSPHWDTGLGDKVVWMIGSQTQNAQLHLNPPNLGPLEIRLSMSDGQANLSFTTQHVAVRDAIEAASPKLRDMMGESGISMGSVSVNVGSFSQQQQAFHQRESSGEASARSDQVSVNQEADVVEPISVSVQSLDERGLVDLFA